MGFHLSPNTVTFHCTNLNTQSQQLIRATAEPYYKLKMRETVYYNNVYILQLQEALFKIS